MEEEENNFYSPYHETTNKTKKTFSKVIIDKSYIIEKYSICMKQSLVESWNRSQRRLYSPGDRRKLVIPQM